MGPGSTFSSKLWPSVAKPQEPKLEERVGVGFSGEGGALPPSPPARRPAVRERFMLLQLGLE